MSDTFDHAFEALEDEICGRGAQEPESTIQARRTCSRCGAKGLRWSRLPQGWRLVYERGPLADKIHGCPQ